MLLRSYAKTNGLKADQVMNTLKQQYPQRQWVGSSKLSPDEIRELNSQFGIGEQLLTLPEATELAQGSVEQCQTENEPLQELPEENQPAGQIQQAPQQLPQSPQSSSEMAQAIQFFLTQQQPQSYSSEVGIEAAKLDGAAQAFRKFTAFHSSEAATTEGLQQLNQTLNDLQIKASVDGFGASQRDFLSELRHNSEKLQSAKSQRQQQAQTVRSQTTDSINLMQSAVVNAVKNLKATGSSRN